MDPNFLLDNIRKCKHIHKQSSSKNRQQNKEQSSSSDIDDSIEDVTHEFVEVDAGENGELVPGENRVISDRNGNTDALLDITVRISNIETTHRTE